MSVTSLYTDLSSLAKAVCAQYGFGDTSIGLFIFFLSFGLSLLLLLLLIVCMRLSIEGYAPRAVLLARAHSVSPTTVLRRVLARKVRNFTRRVVSALRHEGPYLSPSSSFAILRFRSTRGWNHLADMPTGLMPQQVLPVAIGVSAELHMAGSFPSTACFVQVDMEAHAIRWSPTHFITLNTVEEVSHSALRLDAP
eukprot:3135850-Prymnesium_polylepis.2